MIFFFNDTAAPEIYTLSLHDALPISGVFLALADVTGRRVFAARGANARFSAADVPPTIEADAVLVSGYLLLRSEEHTSELQSRQYLVCRILLEKKKKTSLPDCLASVH